MEKVTEPGRTVAKGETFGPFSRFRIDVFETRDLGAGRELRYFLLDAEEMDPLTGGPAIVADVATEAAAREAARILGATAEVRNVRDGWRVGDLQAYMNRAVHTPYESNVSLYLLEVKRIAGALARAAFRAVPGLRDAR
jgi:hypothetical protein